MIERVALEEVSELSSFWPAFVKWLMFGRPYVCVCVCGGGRWFGDKQDMGLATGNPEPSKQATKERDSYSSSWHNPVNGRPLNAKDA